MEKQTHWENVYQTKAPDAVSWFREHLDQSLTMIEACALPAEASIVDAGGGASTLIDDLLAQGFKTLTVMDLSAAALARSRARLGDLAAGVRWVVGDVTANLLPAQSVDLWHDRAVFHFLSDPAQRAAYVAQLRRCVRPGGFVIIATFALDGPERCSGLPVTRHSPGSLAQTLGDDFVLQDSAHERHQTPWGSEQSFVYTRFRHQQQPPTDTPTS